MRFARFGLVAVTAIILTACGQSGPTEEQVRNAVKTDMSAEYAAAVKQFGPEPAALHAIPDGLYSIAAVDNLRASDEATYAADITIELTGNGRKTTRAIVLRQIEGTWSVIHPNR
ncbi:hypothetical protein ACRQ1B_28720 [Rhizobium panacihumi]|uniref:hypothetical protein n=1 Tax=Rhizobium panacihumi TaxID=2008450 RepID=UPI003D7B2385